MGETELPEEVRRVMHLLDAAGLIWPYIPTEESR